MAGGEWSFQLYGARGFQPWEEVLTLLASLEYGQVEGYGDVYGEPAKFRELLDRNGLTMPSGHFSIEDLEDRRGVVEGIAEALGIGLVVCPYLEEAERPRDATGWRAFGERLGRVGDVLGGAGLAFAWHNHDFEFLPLADGTIPMRHMLEAAPNLNWQMDVAWIVRSGSDPLAWMDEFGPRIIAAHVKDLAPAGEAPEEDGWADVGHGVAGWSTLLPALRRLTATRLFVVEHDNPSDLERFARRSIASARRFW